jgi:hypothetical protein
VWFLQRSGGEVKRWIFQGLTDKVRGSFHLGVQTSDLVLVFAGTSLTDGYRLEINRMNRRAAERNDDLEENAFSCYRPGDTQRMIEIHPLAAYRRISDRLFQPAVHIRATSNLCENTLVHWRTDGNLLYSKQINVG